MSEFELFIAFELAILFSVPLCWLLTGYSWLLAHRYWGNGFRLPAVLAVVNTITFYAVVVLGFLSTRALLGMPRIENTGFYGVGSIVVLCYVPSLTTGYLVWLELRRKRTQDIDGLPEHEHDHDTLTP